MFIYFFKLKDLENGLATLSYEDKEHRILVTFSTFEQHSLEKGEGNEEEEQEQEEEQEEKEEEYESKKNKNKKYEDEEDEEDEEMEEEIKEGSDEIEPLPKIQNFIVDIEFLKNGTSKGSLRLKCLAGVENRLYIDFMECFEQKPPAVKLENFLIPSSELLNNEIRDLQKKTFYFDSLESATQDKIYDLLDSLGLDDKMAHFIKQYPVRIRTN